MRESGVSVENFTIESCIDEDGEIRSFCFFFLFVGKYENVSFC